MIRWNWFDPWFVNWSSTIGSPFGPKSAFVPERTRSEPFISGTGLILFVGAYFIR